MKTFWTFLAALLAAGAIFSLLFWEYQRFQVWEKAKNETLAFIESRDSAANEVMSDADHSSIDSLSYALKSAARLSSQRREAIDYLHQLLKSKPILSLTAQEAKFLNQIEQKDEQPGSPPKPGMFFKLTKPVTVTLREGPVILGDEVVLQLTEQHGSRLTADYNGQSVEIPISATEFSK